MADPVPAWEGVQLGSLMLASTSVASSLPLSIHLVMKFGLFSFLKFSPRFLQSALNCFTLCNLLLSVYFRLCCFSCLHIYETIERAPVLGGRIVTQLTSEHPCLLSVPLQYSDTANTLNNANLLDPVVNFQQAFLRRGPVPLVWSACWQAKDSPLSSSVRNSISWLWCPFIVSTSYLWVFQLLEVIWLPSKQAGFLILLSSRGGTSSSHCMPASWMPCHMPTMVWPAFL